MALFKQQSKSPTGNATASTRLHASSPSRFMALEPRILFDGAAAAAADAVNDSAPPQDSGAAAKATQSLLDAAASIQAPTQDNNNAASGGTFQITELNTDNPFITVRGDLSALSDTSAQRHEVVVVDATVVDWQTLVAGISPDTPLIVLHPDGNGMGEIEMLASFLSKHQNLDAIHLVTEGRTGALQLGNEVLYEGDLQAASPYLAEIGAALKPGGDLMLYGCSVAAGDTGHQFIDDLSHALGDVDVAASTDKTGPTALGGDWDLEYQTGAIETVLPFTLAGMQDISHCLGCTVSAVTYSRTPVPTHTYTGFRILGGDSSTTVAMKLTSDVYYSVAGSYLRYNPPTYSFQDFGPGATGWNDLIAALGSLCDTSNTAPTFTSAAAFSVSENATNDSTTLLDVNATDAESNPISYSITGGTGSSLFSINSSTGIITLNATGASTLNRETAANYTLTVRADDGQSSSNTTDQSITVTVTDVAPAVTAGQSFSIAENSSNGTVIGTVANTGDNDGITWSIQSGNTGNVFAINSSTGQITVNGALNYEATSSYTLGIRATDGTTQSNQNVTVNITNVDEGATLIAPATVDFDTVGAGWDTSIGTNLGSNSYTNNNFNFVYVDGFNTNIWGFGNAGQSGSPSIILTGGSSQVETLTITNTNAQTFKFSSFYLNNGGFDLGTWTITGKLGGSTVGPQTITTASSGVVTLNSSLQNVDTIVISSTSGGFNGAWFDSFNFDVPVVNVAPTVTGTPSDVTVTEDTASNFDLSAVSIADVDGDNLTVTLAASAGTFAANTSGSVTVGGSGTGTLTLSGSAANINTWLDSVNNIQYTGASNASGNNAATFTLKANDGTVDSSIANGNIDITAVNDTPTNISLSSSSVAENTDTTGGLTIGALTTTDADSGDTFTYSIVGGADQNDFQISGGNLQFKAGTTLNYETKSSYSVTVRAADAGSATYDKTFTISLTDVNEAPSIANAIPDQSASATQAFSFQFPLNTFADQDSGQTLTYTATKADGSALPAWITFNAATRTFSGTPAPGDAGTLSIKVTATDNGTGSLSVFDTFDVVVSNGPSVSSIVRAGGASATVAGSATSVDYTVTFSESVTSVDASDFSLTTTGTATGTIASISGSGTTYTVTVNSITGDGTLRLDLNGSGTGIQNGSLVDIVSGYTSGQTYTLDHTNPSAPSAPDLASGSDSGSSNTDNITSDNTPTFTGTAEANSTVTLYDTDGTTVLGTATADGSGNWSITSSALSSGSHTITAKATDAAGNTSGASSGLSVTVDTTVAAPGTPDLAAGSDSGSSTDNVTSATTPTFTGTAEPNSTVTLYDTDGITVLGTATADGSGNWSITSSALSQGSHTITAKATDVAGNTSSASSGLSVTVDTTAPAAPSTPDLASGSDSGSSNTDNITSDATPTFTGTAEPNSTVTLYDTDGTTVLGTATADGSGNWSITSATLSQGSHTITAKVRDAAGNTSNASSGLSVAVDTTVAAPGTPDLAAGSDSGSSSTDNVTSDNTPTFTGTAEANSTVTLYDTDGTTVLGTATADGSGNWSITSSALSSGSHTITAKATDAAGNTSGASSGLSVTVDTTIAAPSTPDLAAGSDSGSSSTDNVTSATTPTFTGTAEPNSTVTLYDTDGTTVLGTATANGSGNWSITSSTLSQGSHTITAKATDAAGNTSSASSGLSIAVDATAPTTPAIPTLVSNIDGVLVISGNAEDGAIITLFDSDGTTVIATTIATGGTWRITNSTLAVGSHTLIVTTTDLAGNVSTPSAGLSVIIASSSFSNATQTVEFNGSAGLLSPAGSSSPFFSPNSPDSDPAQGLQPSATIVAGSGSGSGSGLGNGGTGLGGGFGLGAGSFGAGGGLGHPSANPAFGVDNGGRLGFFSTSSQWSSVQMQAIAGDSATNSFTIPAEALISLDTASGVTFQALQADGSSLPAWVSFDSGSGAVRLSGDAPEQTVIKVTATDGKGNQTVITIVLKPAEHGQRSGHSQPQSGNHREGQSGNLNQPQAMIGKPSLSEQLKSGGSQRLHSDAQNLLSRLATVFNHNRNAA